MIHILAVKLACFVHPAWEEDLCRGMSCLRPGQGVLVWRGTLGSLGAETGSGWWSEGSESRSVQGLRARNSSSVDRTD